MQKWAARPQACRRRVGWCERGGRAACRQRPCSMQVQRQCSEAGGRGKGVSSQRRRPSLPLPPTGLTLSSGPPPTAPEARSPPCTGGASSRERSKAQQSVPGAAAAGEQVAQIHYCTHRRTQTTSRKGTQGEAKEEARAKGRTHVPGLKTLVRKRAHTWSTRSSLARHPSRIWGLRFGSQGVAGGGRWWEVRQG